MQIKICLVPAEPVNPRIAIFNLPSKYQCVPSVPYRLIKSLRVLNSVLVICVHSSIISMVSLIDFLECRIFKINFPENKYRSFTVSKQSPFTAGQKFNPFFSNVLWASECTIEDKLTSVMSISILYDRYCSIPYLLGRGPICDILITLVHTLPPITNHAPTQAPLIPLLACLFF